MDLDGFKEINDSFGHENGDRILRLAANTIMESIRESDFAARLGGDEFICALSGIKTLDDAHEIASKIIERMRQIHLPAGDELHLGVSVGLLIVGPDQTDPEDIVKQADNLMYEQSGKGRYTCKDLTAQISE